MDPFQVTPRTLGIAGAITVAGGACTALAAPKKARRIRQAGQLAAILGTGLIVLADIERHARELTEDEMYQRGFDDGHRQGRKIAKPTVVPIRPCKCQRPTGNPATPTRAPNSPATRPSNTTAGLRQQSGRFSTPTPTGSKRTRRSTHIMAVLDLWYLKNKDPNGKRVKSKRYGRGRRYRVDYVDAAGEETSKSFDNWTEAKHFDASCRAGVAPEVNTDRATEELTFPDYAEQWRSARQFSWELETQKRIPSNIGLHLAPAFPGRIRKITQTDVLRWISNRLTEADSPTPKSTMKLYYSLLNTILNAALVDKKIDANPCKGIKLSAVFKGVDSRPRWVPNENQLLDLYDVTPPEFQVALTLGSNQALRIGEALGLEDSSHCFDFENGKLHVVQQLGYNRAKFGGFFLKEPKQGSRGTIDFDTGAMVAVQNHLDKYGYTEIELVDAVDPRNIHRRTAKLILADGRIPFHDSRWSEVWIPWRRAAGWPEAGGTFHALRHFCAVMLLLSGVDPQYVQNHLRHKMLQTTLAIYSHWLPRNERPRNIISSVLGQAMKIRKPKAESLISSQLYPALTG